jgi:hypothetical protein
MLQWLKEVQDMPAIAPLEELAAAQAALAELRQRQPQAYAEFVELFRLHRHIGYKNLSRLMMGEATPEKLKGGE